MKPFSFRPNFRRTLLRPSLFQKLFFLLIAVVLLLSAGLAYLTFQVSKTQIETISSAFLQDNLQNNVRRLNFLYQETEAYSEKIIGNEKLQQLLRDSLSGAGMNEMQFISQMIPIVDELRGEYELSIYPLELERYPNYLRSAIGSNETEAPEWLPKALELEGKGFWQVEGSTQNGLEKVLFIRSIRSFPQLQTLAVMAIQVPVPSIQRLLISPNLYPNFRFAIRDERGRTILPMEERQPHESLNVRFSEEKNDIVVVDDEPYYRAIQQMDKIGWLVATVPVSDSIGPVNRVLRWSWLAVLIGTTSVSAILWIIVRRFTAPIAHVVDRMRKTRYGDLSPSMRYAGRHDEIGHLTRGYNVMVASIGDLIATVKKDAEVKRKLEMSMLVHQINPHFLYNTLDSIKWRAEIARDSVMSEMIASLVNLLRFALNGNEESTTVERELEHVKSYLRIEQLRRKDGFSTLFNVQPNVLQLPLLKLIVQPLAENAVKHGLSKLPHGKGKLLISVYAEDEDLAITIEDNGPGLRQSVDPGEEASETKGIGLYNVHRRLQMSFGENYGVQISNRRTGGCKVEIRHPILPRMGEKP